MAMTDPIADMLTRIRNANQRRHETVSMPASNKKLAMAKILKKEGFITDYTESNIGNNKKELKIALKYKNNQRAINGLKRISKPGLKVYVEASKIPKVYNGLGVAIVSTSKGIVTDREARKNNDGGEIMAFI